LEPRFFIRKIENYLPAVIVELAIVVVVITGPSNDSHRAPVYRGGQSQYGTFPFIRQIPPDRQYPSPQVTSKHQMTFIHK
jgi:hypothetical protein